MKPFRPQHVKIMKVLEAMDPVALQRMDCYFGGGTAISLLTNEYRLSVDVDFMCASREGYAALRESVFDSGLNALFKDGVPEQLREIRADRDGVRTILNMDGTPLKFEIVFEARIALQEEAIDLPVPTLSRHSLFTEKLLANTDRGLDQSGLNKDMLDLIVMQNQWGNIPMQALMDAKNAYGHSAARAFEQVFLMLSHQAGHLERCIRELDITESSSLAIKTYLGDPLNSQYVMRAFDHIDQEAKANRPG